jgi:hypothetical protein
MEQVKPVAVELLYYNDPDHRSQSAAIFLGWCALIVGVVASIADLARVAEVMLLGSNGLLRFYRSQPIYFAQFLFGCSSSLAQHSLMMLGGAMALLRRRFAWHLAISYPCVSIAQSAVSILLAIGLTLGRGPSTETSIQAVWQCTGAMAQALFMCMVVAILRRPAVREMFEKVILRPARPAGAGC